MKRAATALAITLGIAAGVSAAPVTVAYRLSGGFGVSLFGSLGPSGTGTLIVEYSGSAANASLLSIPLPPGAPAGIVSGPVQLVAFDFAQMLAFPVGPPGPVLFTGTAAASGSATASGSLADGSLAIPLHLVPSGWVHCVGPGACAAGIPASTTSPLAIPPYDSSLAAFVGTPPNIGTVFQPDVLSVVVGTINFGLGVVATEVARHVPEPDSTPLMSVGLVGLAICYAHYRRRVRRRA